jgi:4-amino-4-deoxy-L-arabinose transferase-like glycosyltransferase
MNALHDGDFVRRNEQRYHRLGWLLVAVLLAWLLAPTLFARGMFLDGVIYGVISRNMAVGIGDFWHPKYMDAEPGVFHEHPPLAFGLQAILFRMCGDQFWVERLYSTLCAPGLIAVIALLWRSGAARVGAATGCGWFPVLLWMAIPSWGWLYKNNVLENTLAPLAALSVYASVRLHQGGRLWRWSGLAAAAMLAAGLAKGPVGLFPAVTPLIAGVCLADCPWKTVVRNQAAVLLWCCALAAALCCYEPARQFLNDYFHDQLVSSLAGKRIIQHGRWYLAWRTLTALALPATLALLIAAWGNRRSALASCELAQSRRLAWFYLLTALSASVPLLLSPRQSAMYAAPSYPFYVLALALHCWPGALALQAGVLKFLSSRMNYRAAIAALAILLLAALLRSSSNYGVIVRDRELLNAVARIQAAVPARSLIAMSEDLWCDFQLRAYLCRSRHVSLVGAKARADFYLASANGSATDPAGPAGHRELSLRSHLRQARAASDVMPR